MITSAVTWLKDVRFIVPKCMKTLENAFYIYFYFFFLQYCLKKGLILSKLHFF